MQHSKREGWEGLREKKRKRGDGFFSPGIPYRSASRPPLLIREVLANRDGDGDNSVRHQIKGLMSKAMAISARAL